jgi:hypothetical protein
MGGFLNVSSVYVICSAAASYIFHLFFFICRLVRMEGGGYWSNMVTGDDVDVAGLEDFTFPMIHDMPSQAEQVDVQVQPRQGAGRPTSTKGSSKRTKNFDPKEDLVVCSAWLNVSKDPIHGANQTRSLF